MFLPLVWCPVSGVAWWSSMGLLKWGATDVGRPVGSSDFPRLILASRRGSGVGTGAATGKRQPGSPVTAAAPAHLQKSPIARHVFLLDERRILAGRLLARQPLLDSGYYKTGSRSSRIGLPPAPGRYYQQFCHRRRDAPPSTGKKMRPS